MTTMQTKSEPKWAVVAVNRPHCPRHNCLLRVETSKGAVAYAYCPKPGCQASAKVLRQRVGTR